MRLRWAAPALAGVALLLLLLAGPAVRLRLWDFGTGFSLLRWSAYIGLAAVAAALVSLLTRTGRRSVLLQAAALIVGGGVAYVPWHWLQQARRVPPIHDITTDLEHPPEFVAVLPLRAGAPNPAAYGGPEVAAAQRKGYPDLHPLLVHLAPGPAFVRALATARAMGWELVAADSTAHRIEATATTPWFGFKDDVVIRIEPDPAGSRVDVRSVSRVGGSDVGTNARRIRAYLARLAAPASG
ncbi:MAG TPA: DUF1499 domain-containing protein [Gemmatimonadales bacterium]|jgi:uncharacterized protein (DUF1499 family)|nr:DUF1499 domain-containing protein [Gemmatimonadales bacterium]